MKVLASALLGWAIALNVSAAAVEESPGGWRIDAPASLRPGEVADLNIVFALNAPWSVYAPTRVNEALGVTGLDVSLQPAPGLAISKPEFPPPTDYGRFQAYSSENVTIRQRLRAEADIEPGEYRVAGYVEYQFCRPDLCLPPRRNAVAFSVKVE